MTYTIEAANGVAEQLEFNEADMESVGLEAADFEGLESLESLESISVETVAEDLEGYMEGVEATATPSSYVNKRLLQIFTALVKTSIKKITSNPKTRAKLQAACRKSPDAVIQLLTPIIAKALPTYFKWMPAIFVPPIVARLFPAICKQAGLKPEEIPVVAEFLGALFMGATLLPSVFDFFRNRRRR
jgi:hypothetical protein